jgi:RNA polymerase sigma factor (sigma-70 family)
MSETDLELLARYVRHRAEDAFAEIVRRHLDLVHSAALRQVRSPQLAEEVAQCAFLKLTRHAGQLAPGTILSAWLYQVTRREAIDVVRREACRRLREQIATEMNAMNAPAADWTHIEPLLDEAMHALDETDRAAVLLRYFENKSLREVGQALGTSDDTAQKRISRAVERLREFFAKRGVTVGTSGLIVVVSANAVQAAPVGLAVTISTTAVLAGTTLTTTATATATKAIAMTTMQKTLIGATLVAAVGTGIYEARRAAVWRERAVELHDQAGSKSSRRNASVTRPSGS